MNLEQVIWLTIGGLFFWFLVRHHQIRARAYEAALRHTRHHQVTLLDESLTLKKLAFLPSPSSLVALRRHFRFEFSSLGDERYEGEVVFIGARQAGITLQAFKTDFKGEPLE